MLNGKRYTSVRKEGRREAHTLQAMRTCELSCEEGEVRSVRLRQDEEDQEVQLAGQELQTRTQATESETEEAQAQERQESQMKIKILRASSSAWLEQRAFNVVLKALTKG